MIDGLPCVLFTLIKPCCWHDLQGLYNNYLPDFLCKLPTQPQIYTAYEASAAVRSKQAMLEVAELLRSMQVR